MIMNILKACASYVEKTTHLLIIWAIKLPIHIYRLTFSSLVGNQCRYHPTCSAYALEALQTHGPLTGLFLTVKRLIRCHPWARSGVDPVPPSISD